MATATTTAPRQRKSPEEPRVTLNMGALLVWCRLVTPPEYDRNGNLKELTRSDIARALGITNLSTLTRFLNGTRTAGVESLSTIVAAFTRRGIPAETVLESLITYDSHDGNFEDILTRFNTGG